MGTGHMGTGHMGMGHMGTGHMGMGHMGMGHMGMHDYHIYRLDLTESQRKSMRNIRKETRAELIELQDKIAEHSDQLYSLYDQDKPDAKKIGEVYQKIFDLKRQIIELQINIKNQQYDKLTKEQRERLKKFRYTTDD
jgi:Spy/CpxP family protein refolding chaperone